MTNPFTSIAAGQIADPFGPSFLYYTSIHPTSKRPVPPGSSSTALPYFSPLPNNNLYDPWNHPFKPSVPKLEPPASRNCSFPTLSCALIQKRNFLVASFLGKFKQNFSEAYRHLCESEEVDSKNLCAKVASYFRKYLDAIIIPLQLGRMSPDIDPAKNFIGFLMNQVKNQPNCFFPQKLFSHFIRQLFAPNTELRSGVTEWYYLFARSSNA